MTTQVSCCGELPATEPALQMSEMESTLVHPPSASCTVIRVPFVSYKGKQLLLLFSQSLGVSRTVFQVSLAQPLP